MIQFGRKFIHVAYVGRVGTSVFQYNIPSYTANSRRSLPIYTVVYNYCLLSQLQKRVAIGRHDHVTEVEQERVCV